MAARWTDLLDPSEDEVRQHVPKDIEPAVVAELVRATPTDAQQIRPTLQGYGDYVFGRFLAAVLVNEEDRVFYQEVDIVLTHDRVLTVRKTPDGERPYDPSVVEAICAKRSGIEPGMIAYHLLDDIAERYLDLLDDFHDEIDGLEEQIERWSDEQTRRCLSALRRDLLQIRRTLTPTRDAVRGVVDGRVDLEGRPMFRREVFPRDVEQQFTTVYDKLLRATEALELARELLAAARDFHQTKISIDQNEVMKKLTVVASLLLLPTFIVGLYGQNFRHHFPELGWQFGYLWSWGLIVATTVAQLIFFRWRRWI